MEPTVKKTLTIKAITSKQLSGGKTLYKAITNDGEYECWSAGIKEYEGKTHEFDTYTKQNGQYVNHYIQLGDRKSFGGGGGKGGSSRPWSPPDRAAMVLRYATDIAIAHAQMMREKPQTPAEMATNAYASFKVLYDQLQKEYPLVAPTPAEPAAQGMTPQQASNTMNTDWVSTLKATAASFQLQPHELVGIAKTTNVFILLDRVTKDVKWETLTQEGAKKVVDAIAAMYAPDPSAGEPMPTPDEEVPF